MPLKRMQIDRFRNIDHCSIDLHKTINLFVGENGSGKSSLLESIYMMFTGRSFRTRRPVHYISFGEKDCVVSAELTQQNVNFGCDFISIALQKHFNGKIGVRMGANHYSSSLPIAKLTPVQFHSPEEPLLIDAVAEQRRRFVDWAMFHVEHQFSDLWVKAQKLLKHRNSLLRSGVVNYSDLEPWDSQLCPLHEEITRLRKSHVDKLLASFLVEGPFVELIKSLELSLKFYRGWSEEYSLKEQLRRSFEKDIVRGYTQYGAHRADLKIKSGEGNAKEKLSRGQKKALNLHLKMLQNSMVGEAVKPKTPLFLLDDICSEFDKATLKTFFEWLMTCSVVSQLFITAIDINDVRQLLKGQSYQVFHVEHGGVNMHRMSSMFHVEH